MDNKNLVSIAAGWVKQSKGGVEYISGSSGGKNQKTKLFVELEDGTFLKVNSFMAFFAKTKKSEASPDLNFVVDVEKQESQQK